MAIQGSEPLRSQAPRVGLRRALVVTAAVFVTVISAAGLSSGSRGVAVPELAILSIDAEVVDDRVQAEVSVQNTTNARLEGAVWWLLSLVDGANAWDDSVYRSLSQPVDLKAGESVQLDWIETPAIPPGRYMLSAWVHAADWTGAMHHSDTKTPDPTIVEFARSPDIARTSAQTGDVAIASAEPTVTAGFPTKVDVQIELEYSGGPSQPGAVQADFIETTPADPRWWTHSPTAVIAETLQLDSGPNIRADLQGSVLLPPGDYVIAISASTGSGGTDRGLLTRSAFSVPDYDSSTRRLTLPNGPLMVASIDASERWLSSDDSLVTIEVRNVTDEDVTGVLWWHLGDPDDPEPWRFASATSYRLTRSFGSGESRIVRLAVDGALPAGNYELSVWAHIVESGQSRHSDEVRFPAMITVENANGGEDEDR